MPANAFQPFITGRMLPPGASAIPKRSGLRSAIFASGFAPAQMMPMIFAPCLSFSASNMRCAGAVKSVVACGTYSSCTIVALLPIAASASLNAFTPSRPNA